MFEVSLLTVMKLENSFELSEILSVGSKVEDDRAVINEQRPSPSPVVSAEKNRTMGLLG